MKDPAKENIKTNTSTHSIVGQAWKVKKLLIIVDMLG